MVSPKSSMLPTSRSPHGERGLKFGTHSRRLWTCGRSPHGERGLKSIYLKTIRKNTESLSSWRAWIEISRQAIRMAEIWSSLSSWRAWIEIFVFGHHTIARKGRSPHGERGLKCMTLSIRRIRKPSRSPHGERGLKSVGLPIQREHARRSPHGERGLKSRRT